MQGDSPTVDAFEEDARPEAGDDDKLLLNLDGYEGPIDVLLDLARNQKVDLTKISILALARQYLAFIDRARALKLELAAEYLVMAAWLAYLKSRLLLPKQEGGQQDYNAEDMAEALQFQLRRLEAMQDGAAKLMKRPRLGQEIFARRAAEGLKSREAVQYTVSLYDIVSAYGHIRKRTEGGSGYELPQFRLMSMENALERFTRMLGNLPKSGASTVWATLDSFIPGGIKDRLYGRSALASTFTAGLELVKQGRLEMRQDGAMRPIYVRGKSS